MWIQTMQKAKCGHWDRQKLVSMSLQGEKLPLSSNSMSCELDHWANKLWGQGGSAPEWTGSQPGAPSLGLCLQQPWGRSHWDQERRAALWQLIRTLPGTFGTPMCKSLFYANDFLQMFWNVLTVLVWFSKALMVWFEGNSSRSCSSEPIQDLPGHPAATGYGGANSCLPQENKIR